MKSAVIAAFVMLTVTFAPPAHAHSGLIGSSPADGETVAGAVSQIKLRFSQPVRVTLVRVGPQDADPVEPKSDLPGSFVEVVEVAVPTLEPGDYSTKWTAVAQDGHVMTGAFAFTVAD
jgi:methionine-rich copper-binding protein CopC